jgi:anaerobic magnesium-protoporphyrin IX monomethyl ester cyclase
VRVLLVSLPGSQQSDGGLFPLGPAYLASALKGAHDIECHHYDDIASATVGVPAALRRFRPALVGLTCSTFNRGFVRDAIRAVRRIDPQIVVVVGGVHASFCWEQVIKDYGADFVVIGEGERTIVDLCATLERRGTPHEVRGIAWKSGNGVAVTPPRDPISDLDELPLPDFSFARRFMERTGMGFVITSRGCPVRCTFCSTSSYWGQKVRLHSPRRVVDEMERLVSTFAVKRIFFHDDTFNLGVSRVKAICREIKARGLNVTWGCSCRVVPVSDDMIESMVEAGCRHICWGVESGSEAILKTIHKKITLPQIRRAYELSRRYSGIMSTGAFSVVGNPGETDRTVRDTVDFFNSLPLTDAPSTSILYVLPGTGLYDDLKRSGHIEDTTWVERDSIPLYTVENSLLTLLWWSRRVRGSGRRIPFDTHRHFWRLAAAPVGATERVKAVIATVGNLAVRVRRAATRIPDYTSTGRLFYSE